MGCAMDPASSVNCAVLSLDTSSMRFTGREFMSELNSCTGARECCSRRLPNAFRMQRHQHVWVPGSKVHWWAPSWQGFAAGANLPAGQQVYLISEHRKTFLQGQLEPVTAGHTVPCPVVEIPACRRVTALVSRCSGKSPCTFKHFPVCTAVLSPRGVR